MQESRRQLAKWGVQTRTPAEWMLYLTEEVGELAEAISEREYRDGTSEDVLKEALQVATLALKIAEIYFIDDMEKRGPHDRG
jgi:NTP pyrophosphatase (non-canonical NTP hydrolase)